MRTAHFSAFDALVRVRVPALAELVFDGDVPLDADGSVLRASYIVLHDMGFDEQNDDRLSASTDDVADGTYRIVGRVVAETRAAVRAVADALTSGIVKQTLTIADRFCGPIQKDIGPNGIERDDDVTPPLLYTDIDFIWRSQRA